MRGARRQRPLEPITGVRSFASGVHRHAAYGGHQRASRAAPHSGRHRPASACAAPEGGSPAPSARLLDGDRSTRALQTGAHTRLAPASARVPRRPGRPSPRQRVCLPSAICTACTSRARSSPLGFGTSAHTRARVSPLLETSLLANALVDFGRDRPVAAARAVWVRTHVPHRVSPQRLPIASPAVSIEVQPMLVSRINHQFTAEALKQFFKVNQV